VLWTISTYLVKWIRCVPEPYNWDKTIPGGKCINTALFLAAASESVNSVIDFVMLVLAIRIVSMSTGESSGSVSCINLHLLFLKGVESSKRRIKK
jgi:hypothetical protein